MEWKKDLEKIEIGAESVLRFLIVFWMFFGLVALIGAYFFGVEPSQLFLTERFSNIFWLVASAAMIVVWREIYRVRRLLERESTGKYRPVYQRAREKLGI